MFKAKKIFSQEASLSPIRLPIDDTGQFIDSPTVPGIDFDFESHSARVTDVDGLVGDALSVVVHDGFPVVT